MMLLTPELCRAARALLGWKPHQLASAAGLGLGTVRRFEGGGIVRLPSVEAMLHALEGAGLEFIPAGGQSLYGGPGLRSIPMAEPEVAEAEEAAALDEPAPGMLRGPGVLHEVDPHGADPQLSAADASSSAPGRKHSRSTP